MTINDFLILEPEQKAKAVWQGNFIALSEEGGCKILLYKLENFYVEVFYNEHNLIKKIKPFKTIAVLKHFLHENLN